MKLKSISFFMLCLLSIGCATQKGSTENNVEETIEQAMLKGEKAFVNKKYEVAEEKFRKALALKGKTHLVDLMLTERSDKALSMLKKIQKAKEEQRRKRQEDQVIPKLKKKQDSLEKAGNPQKARRYLLKRDSLSERSIPRVIDKATTYERKSLLKDLPQIPDSLLEPLLQNKKVPFVARYSFFYSPPQFKSSLSLLNVGGRVRILKGDEPLRIARSLHQNAIENPKRTVRTNFGKFRYGDLHDRASMDQELIDTIKRGYHRDSEGEKKYRLDSMLPEEVGGVGWQEEWYYDKETHRIDQRISFVAPFLMPRGPSGKIQGPSWSYGYPYHCPYGNCSSDHPIERIDVDWGIKVMHGLLRSEDGKFKPYTGMSEPLTNGSHIFLHRELWREAKRGNISLYADARGNKDLIPDKRSSKVNLVLFQQLVWYDRREKAYRTRIVRVGFFREDASEKRNIVKPVFWFIQ